MQGGNTMEGSYILEFKFCSITLVWCESYSDIPNTSKPRTGLAPYPS